MQTLWTVVAVAIAKACRITSQEMYEYVSAMVQGANSEAPGDVGGELVAGESDVEDEDEESGTRKFGFR